MSGSSLSDRLKNVEDEINEITSLMSLHDGSESRMSVTRSLSDTITASGKSSRKSLAMSCLSGSSLKLSSSSTSSSMSSSSRKVNSRGGVSASRESNSKKLNILERHRPVHSRNNSNNNSRSSSRSDTKLKNGYSVSRSSYDNLSDASSKSTVGNGDMGRRNIQKIKKTNDLPSSIIGDSGKMSTNMDVPLSFDSLQMFLHNINNSIIEGNQAVMSKITDSCLEMSDRNSKSESASCSVVKQMNSSVIQYQDLMKEIEEERDKRIKKELFLEELKEDLNKCKEDLKKQKDLCRKYREQNEKLEEENKKKMELMKANEKTNEEREMELELYKQKYDAVFRDLKMEQEHTWVLERDLQQLKDCYDQSQLKIQELLGARTMAVELAHDLQKKHQSYVVDHQYEVQDLKNKISELEKLLSESIHEKSCVVERLQSMEEYPEKYKELQKELDEYKKNIADAEKTICELTRNPEGIPQVRNMLNTQEQTFKAALNEKATSEMALQAKYTTLEVELQIIQDDYNKRLQEFEEEKNKLMAEAEKKSAEQAAEIDRLKVVTEELTELSNQYKSRISELSDINKQQEVLIKCQNEAISSKEERVKLNNQEAELNIRRVEQEKKALILEHEKAINNYKKLLDEERDKLRVKDKIADDQTETIMNLRQNLSDKAKEVQRKLKEIHRLEQSLKQEKMEKDNLSCDVQHLKMHRARMNETIADLQKQLEVAQGNNVHKKHTQMLEELEKKVSQKQMEWESEISKLKTERDQARETAQYAIENLSSAMEEYQKELANQKALQTKLAGLIKEKEEQLNSAENRVKVLTSEIINSERQFSQNRKSLEKKLAKARQLYTDAKKII